MPSSAPVSRNQEVAASTRRPLSRPEPTLGSRTARQFRPKRKRVVGFNIAWRWGHITYFSTNTWNVIRDPSDGLFKCCVSW